MTEHQHVHRNGNQVHEEHTVKDPVCGMTVEPHTAKASMRLRLGTSARHVASPSLMKNRNNISVVSNIRSHRQHRA